MNAIIKICWATVIAFCLITVATAAGETKRVCKMDEKTKKEVCKDIKVHKKLEGTPVPEKSAKKYLTGWPMVSIITVLTIFLFHAKSIRYPGCA